jgi:hypothetical protein
VKLEERIYLDVDEGFGHSINNQTLVSVYMMVVFGRGAHRGTYISG